jgi:hypothetical protein
MFLLLLVIETQQTGWRPAGIFEKQSASTCHCEEGERILRVRSSMRVGHGFHTSSTLSCRGSAQHRSRASWEKLQDSDPARCLGSAPLGDAHHPSRYPDVGQHGVLCEKVCPGLSAATPGIDLYPPADCVICTVAGLRGGPKLVLCRKSNTGIIMHAGPASKINILGGMAHHSPTVGPLALWDRHPSHPLPPPCPATQRSLSRSLSPTPQVGSLSHISVWPP